MNHTEKIEIDKDKPINSLKKAVQFHLTEKEQTKLANQLLKFLSEPPEFVEKYANLHSSRNQEGGYLNATKKECWIMAKQDYEKHEKEKTKRIFTKLGDG